MAFFDIFKTKNKYNPERNKIFSFSINTLIHNQEMIKGEFSKRKSSLNKQIEEEEGRTARLVEKTLYYLTNCLEDNNIRNPLYNFIYRGEQYKKDTMKAAKLVSQILQDSKENYLEEMSGVTTKKSLSFRRELESLEQEEKQMIKFLEDL